MSTVYSVGYTQYLANQKVAAGKWGARMRLYFDEYEAVALAAASTIYMFIPAKGQKYAGFGQLAVDKLGAAAQRASVGVGITAAGVAAVPAAFLALSDTHTAADKFDLDAGAAAIDYLGYEFDGETAVTVTTDDTGGTNTHTGTIKLAMWTFFV